MADDRIFPDEFVPNIQTANKTNYNQWRSQNPGEAAKWEKFRDDVIQGKQVTAPSLSTKYGKALVAAGKLHMSVTDIGSIPPITPPPPPTEPPAILGQGYSIVFEDNFDTLNTNVWGLSNYWYEPEQPGDVFTSGGIMNVLSRASAGNPPRGACTKGAYNWTFGYFETRLRWTANVNAFPAFWMMSKNWIDTGNCNTLKISEWDIFEAFDTGFPHDYQGNLRRNTTGGCGMANSDHITRNQNVPFTLAGQWHTYAGLWTPTTVSYYIDDTYLVGTSAVWDTTNQPMYLLLQMGSHAGALGVDLVSEYEYVRVWQKP